MSENTYVKLAAINVNDHVEKKQNLSYLSWAWAVDQLLRLDPDANWVYGEPKTFSDTLMVSCAVTAFGRSRTSHLPVMDHRNKAIPNPDAFQVNTAMQRCLVKAIALHGLGLYIYAGEDLPEGEEAPKPVGKIPATVGAWESQPLDMQNWLRDLADRVGKLLATEGAPSAYDEIETQDWSGDEMAKVALWTLLDSKQRSAIKAEGTKRNAERKAA